MRLRTRLSIGLAPLLAACGAAPTAEPAKQAGHAVVAEFKGPDGGYDYLSYDPALGRLFVAREYGVMVVDVEAKRVTERFAPVSDTSAVLLIPGTQLLLATGYGEDKAILLDRGTGARIAAIPTGSSPDAALYDPASKLALVMNAKGNDLTLIDVAGKRAVGTIALGGKPEAGVSDGAGHVFVNIEDSADIAVIDVAARRVVRSMDLPGCIEPTGIAHDAVSGLLIAACHNGVAKLIHAATGEDRGTVKVGKDADGAIFDPGRRLAYVPAKDGTLAIFGLDRQGRPGAVEMAPTRPGARTAALDPESGRVFLAASDFRKDAKGEEAQVPGTFRVLVVAPR